MGRVSTPTHTTQMQQQHSLSLTWHLAPPPLKEGKPAASTAKILLMRPSRPPPEMPCGRAVTALGGGSRQKSFPNKHYGQYDHALTRFAKAGTRTELECMTEYTRESRQLLVCGEALRHPIHHPRVEGISSNAPVDQGPS